MNVNGAISLGIDDEKKNTRASRTEVPAWWVRYAERWHRDHGAGASHAQLGIELARVLGRDEPLSYVTVGRFFRQEITTDQIARGLMLLYPDLPPYAVVPVDLEEAIEIQAVQRRAADRRRVAPGRVAALTDAVLARAGVPATPDPNSPERHTSDLGSKNVEAQTGGGKRRGGAGRRRVE